MVLRITIGAALSVTDHYCIIHAVTMVDVRRCARPSRSPHQPCNEGIYTYVTMYWDCTIYRFILYIMILKCHYN